MWSAHHGRLTATETTTRRPWTRLRIVLGCREAGLSLEQTRLVPHRNGSGRDEVIRSQRDQIDRQLTELGITRRFLDHVLTCQHSLMSRCTACSAYART